MKARLLAVAVLVACAATAFAQDPDAPGDAFIPLGWSGNQLFAFMRPAPADLYREPIPRDFEVVVQNLVTDAVLLTRRVPETEHRGAPLQWWQESAGTVRQEVADFGIDIGRTGRRVGPEGFTVGAWRYQAVIRASGQRVDGPGPLGPPEPIASLIDANVIMTADEQRASSSWKRVHAGPRRPSSLSAVTDASVIGFVVSDDNRRAAVVVEWESWGEVAERRTTVIGSNLVVGFERGAIPSNPGQSLGTSLNARTLLAEQALAANPELATIRDLAVDAAFAYLSGDLEDFSAATDPSLGYVTLHAPGVIPVIEHSFTLAESPYPIHSVPSREELAGRITAAEVRMIEASQQLTRLLEFQFDEPTYDTDLLATMERNFIAVVQVRWSPIERLFVSTINGRFIVTVVDMVVPGEA